MLYNDAPIGLCVEGLGSWGVLLSEMRVEPIGGVADQNVIRDWGLQSRLYTPSLALSHLLPVCVVSALLLCKLPACTCPPAGSPETHSYGSHVWCWARISEISTQKQLCFLYKFMTSNVLLVMEGCLMQMRGGKRNDGKGLR